MRSISYSNVAVVGGAGFLGSHLVDHLIEDRNCNVLVLDNLCVGRREFIHPKAKFIHCDITGSEEFLRHVFRVSTIEAVFNYAAWPYIPDSFERPLQVFSVNATGAIKVINAAQEAGVRAILQVSSAELYGDWVDQQSIVRDANRISEDVPVTPHSTYGCAKAAVDYYCQCAWKERNTPVIAMRQFNCVGERETHPYVIPEIISQIASGAQVIRLGNNSFRDFQYAGDAVRMAVRLLEQGQFGEVYNMGSEEGILIYDLAKMISRLMLGRELPIEPDSTRVRPWEIWHLQSNNTKLIRAIGGSARTSLEVALKRTIKHYHDNKGWGF